MTKKGWILKRKLKYTFGRSGAWVSLGLGAGKKNPYGKTYCWYSSRNFDCIIHFATEKEALKMGEELEKLEERHHEYKAERV